ncbi:twin-arginine translocase TatA/TatE family subunit [Mucilaginibacter sp. AW1-7]|jgi:sec-independent protein translocase protein TatA|uniref:Twin-arginine translocase TatA/TatE family subunit n=1 Tax=Mucilaginibacter ginsenosidivorax TaxID=862126 RepID=A0A5B8VXY1_9SPHI|nr:MULTISPECIES: twin-arginine translocase TatA/TatE family subunit [Mucilaginibacter]QEC75148.1 twin-arginine translocase TatA/TatE family subunit [Mucilaginibacter ginsenosidivorax]WDF79971.1 twin-arginine translocase TatA/TatE family subunit [Mucilaginibacter sp. KACC 22773]
MGLGAPEIILIIIAVLLLFGGKKIPELMRGMGQGLKAFNDGKTEKDAAIKE